MPYPEGHYTIPDGSPAYVARRALSQIEQDFRNQVQAIHAAIEALGKLPRVFDADSHGADALKGLLIDGTSYCVEVLLAVDAIPEAEAQAEETWRSDEMRWGR